MDRAKSNYEPCNCPECLEFDYITDRLTDEEFFGNDEDTDEREVSQ